MNRILLILLAVSSYAHPDGACDEERAFEIGMQAIKEAYPYFYQDKAPYTIGKIEGDWVVMGFTQEGMRGGGAPVAVVHPKSCKVLKVYLAR